jgi:5,10-methylenetetrahydromethanopterin reductase
MRFGIQLHGSFPMRLYPELAREVERHPFAELTVHDVVWWRPVWPILTLAAQATERVLIGPDVTHPYLTHPAFIAQNLAGIDELSGGRAILGVGRGSLLEPLGIKRTDAAERVRETVEMVRRLLGGERTEFRGKHFQAGAPAAFLWAPPRAEIPVFVGAFADGTVEACAAWAEEIRPPATWDTRYFEHLRQVAEASAAAAGRRVRLGAEVWTVVGDDRPAARALGRQVLARFLPSMAAMTRFYEVDPEEARGGPEAISDRTLDLFVATGPPDEIAEGVRRLGAAGAETVTFSGRLGEDPLRAIRQLGELVSRLG